MIARIESSFRFSGSLLAGRIQTAGLIQQMNDTGSAKNRGMG